MAKLLLVEDDGSLRFIIQRCLEIDRHLVDLAETAEEAQNALNANEYDLIVMDWNLPDGSGSELCRRFRGLGGVTPVIMLTARGTKADMVEALDGGADDYVTKPFDAQELLARIRALLRRPKAVIPEKLSSGDFELDPNTLELRIGVDKVQLAPKEFALFELLMRFPNKAFTAEAILHRLWPSDTTSAADTLRTHIKNLRKKLGDSDGSIIRYTRSRGYSFSPKNHLEESI
ncbi:MAG: response regulator transcription factor [Candidatus Obscuribacterales bacterium]|nr:response regulator transcription factor [Candidatus Obscuribacterales bacterium]